MVEYNYSNIRIFEYFGPEIQYSYSFVEVSVFRIYSDIRSWTFQFFEYIRIFVRTLFKIFAHLWQEPFTFTLLLVPLRILVELPTEYCVNMLMCYILL